MYVLRIQCMHPGQHYIQLNNNNGLRLARPNAAFHCVYELTSPTERSISTWHRCMLPSTYSVYNIHPWCSHIMENCLPVELLILVYCLQYTCETTECDCRVGLLSYCRTTLYIARPMLSCGIRLSVRLSVTFVYCIKRTRVNVFWNFFSLSDRQPL